MTLYWWMHWFWITTFNLPVLLGFLFLGTSVQSVPSPLVPIVQNGHQNGPYVTKVPSEIPVKSINQPSEEDGHFLSESRQDIGRNPLNYAAASKHSLHSYFKANAIRTPDTYLEEISESMSDDYAVSHTTHSPSSKPLFPFKNPPIISVKRGTSTIRPIDFPSTSDDDDATHGLSPVPRIGTADDKEVDTMITRISTVPPQLVGTDSNDNERTEEEHPLSDGPYSAPTGSVTNSMNSQPKSNWKQLPPASTTIAVKVNITPSTEKPIETRGKTVNKEKISEDHAFTGTTTTTTQAAVLYVTPLLANTSTEIKVGEKHIEDSSTANKVNVTKSESTNWIVAENTSSSVNQVSLDWNASIPGIATSVAKVSRTPGVDIMVSKERVAQAPKQEGLDAASITGIAMGIITAAGLVGAVSFVLYRRRYLNKPQTLNDSNPDSSGYLDESTLRDHSEEMYSLDNDSFLNSLEAMTIQNYWTDSVKHTKL